MTKDMLIMCAVIALVAIMLLAALPEITSAMPEVYYVEPPDLSRATKSKKSSPRFLTTARPLRIAKYFIFMLRHSVRVYGTNRRPMSAPSADTDFSRRRSDESAFDSVNCVFIIKCTT
nr:MAG TPA: hypothetical protein [Myoviridae sp. ct5FH28]